MEQDKVEKLIAKIGQECADKRLIAILKEAHFNAETIGEQRKLKLLTLAIAGCIAYSKDNGDERE